MSTTVCKTCGTTHTWSWVEAFDKFGFGDGDGLVMTEHVAVALRAACYVVIVERWGCHNVIITSIMRGGVELIPEDAKLGYDDPRDYLPKVIVDMLDAAFPAEREVHQ
jgi:hypothetical protein